MLQSYKKFPLGLVLKFDSKLNPIKFSLYIPLDYTKSQHNDMSKSAQNQNFTKLRKESQRSLSCPTGEPVGKWNPVFIGQRVDLMQHPVEDRGGSGRRTRCPAVGAFARSRALPPRSASPRLALDRTRAHRRVSELCAPVSSCHSSLSSPSSLTPDRALLFNSSCCH